ncbi:FAD-dependent monooxygenase [Spongiimicrobium sp. 2-473A-2-J]|uniref:FAD-dependent monooxygenase n=1 Tax=Eudoraea algarum TaxID=3417568 RepID=UPI003D35CB74
MYSIIGGGIGGLTTALAFEKMGVEYQLFEKAERLRPIGSGILLTPNALKVFEWLGILDDIVRSGSPMKRITLTKPDLSPLFDYQQDDVKEKYGHYSLSIHRWELQRILLQGLSNEKIHLGKSLSGFEQEDDGVRMLFEDGTATMTSFLIGADGIHSRIRQRLFPTSGTRYSGQTCWRGICTLDQNISEEYRYRGIEMWGEQLRFGISQIETDKFYWFAVILSPPDEKDKGRVKDRLSTSFKNFHPIVKTLIRATDEQDIIRSDIYEVLTMTKWYHENICLLGDAAHATTPNMGQGGAQAIEDAYFLTRAIKNGGPGSAFARFQKLRAKKVARIVKRSWIMGKAGHWKHFTGLRNLLLKTAPRALLKSEWRSIYSLE